VDISFDIENTGSRAGSDVAQLYSHQLKSVAVQPIQSLRDFDRVTLQPGETKHVVFTLPASQLAWYNVKEKRFAVEPGAFELMIGSSSEDIRLRAQLEVKGSTTPASAKR
jgi:beta-glucosidase